MKLAFVTDAFPPMRSSGAVLMRDLTVEMARRGHEVTVLVPAPRIAKGHAIENADGVRVVRLKTAETRDRAYSVRLAAELAMPFLMRRRLRSSPVDESGFEGVVWYSPSIFFGPLARFLKARSRAPGYLVLRDIFPEWAVDLGLMRRGPAYRLLQAIARGQYRAADTIGVQTPGNLAFFGDAIANGKDVEVLQNWTNPDDVGRCSIDLARGPLAGRKVFAYTGNMGIAQGMDKLLDLATALREEKDIGFAFVGRGSEVARLRELADGRGLDNCVFHDEIGIDEMPGLFAQVDVGMVCLDHRHSWHNIPGKFIAYAHAGLPVLASVNPGNDMIALVEEERVGRISTEPAGRDLAALARELVSEADLPNMGERAKGLAQRLFSVEAAAAQIETALIRHAEGLGGKPVDARDG
ncbi:glycosyltransferase family 4 protein [Erythrobacter sp.]|uniref:glycosyltransferase family 4 protein n=1 Tax=Erythrobacter sp. TaxID=1042 RepID=UPI003C706F2D